MHGSGKETNPNLNKYDPNWHFINLANLASFTVMPIPQSDVRMVGVMDMPDLASSTTVPDSPYSLNIFTMNTKQPVPNSLRFYRKQAGLRQVDVAAKLGFTSYDRISHWEKGSAFPSVTNLFRLAALYKVPAQELYGEFTKTVEAGLHASVSSQEQTITTS